MTNVETIQRLIPEILLIVSATAIYVASAFRVSPTMLRMAGRTAILLAVVFLAWPGMVASRLPASGLPESGILFGDELGMILRLIAVSAGSIFLYSEGPYQRGNRSDSLEGERIGSALLVFAGCMLVSMAADMSLLFVGMELVSIPTYALLFLGRRDDACSESAIKYFLLSIFASAFLLYGLAWTYLLTGTTALSELQNLIAVHGWTGMLPFAVLLVFLGMAFKMAAVPMHFYAADVYQGTTSLNAGLLAVAPKIAGVAGLLRLVHVWGPEFGPIMVALFALIPMLTMSIGNVGALWQGHVRRLLAYSSVAHAGYLLIGIAVVVASGATPGRVDGETSVLLYLLVYAIAALGLFAALAGLRAGGRPVEQVDEVAGLARREPWMAFAICVFLFSMAGIPPLAGFWGKLSLFAGAVRVATEPTSATSTATWLIILAVVGALNAAVAAAYYLRMISTICFREPIVVDGPTADPRARQAALLCAAILLVIGIYPTGVISGLRRAIGGPAVVVQDVARDGRS